MRRLDQPASAAQTPATTRRYDVVILGGGPAGAAAALALRQLDPALAVAIVERSTYERVRIGETLPPTVQPLLAQLGLWPAFLAEAFTPSYGTRAAWGSAELHANDWLFQPYGHSWHLDRRRFDRLLARAAAGRGADLLTGARLTAARRTTDGWQLRIVAGAQPLDAHARFVIDASGRQASFARAQGARVQALDRLMAAVMFFATPLPDSATLIESCAWGWWYCGLLPDQRLVVACMSDADIAKARELRHLERWLAGLDTAQHTRQRLRAATAQSTPLLCTARTQRLDPIVGEGWLATGDAAAAWDPLSSQGIVKALRSGVLAAYASFDALQGRPEGLERYAALLRQEFASYLETWSDYYAREQRWPEAPFWQRRVA